MMQCVGVLSYAAACWSTVVCCSVLEYCHMMQCVGVLSYAAVCWSTVIWHTVD